MAAEIQPANPAHTNRLAREKSPYLLQHAHNPVDWYPWGEEAFERARAEDKPILLSVGYSACHWCHVMERESFEDPDIAALMNRHFVSVKVDREERPDVDQIYMQAVQSKGGLGGAPKFPQPMIWEFVLRFWKRSKSPRARQMAHTTLTMMARGGMYDQVGGGFHRYSVDAHWLVPHFEKMLYDNAQLASLYLHAWLAFGDPDCRRVAEETLDYILREMTDPAGGFYSAQDADPQGHEGKFFVWTPEELREILGPADAEYASQDLGVDRGPNFEGKSILFVAGKPEAERIASIRGKLYAARERRVHPARDDKVLAGWNGLACRAFAEAGRALDRPDYVAAAVRNADFVLRDMRRDGRLLRSWKAGEAKLKGYLEDGALVAAALIDVYEATFDRRWLDEARALADGTLRLFWDERPRG